MNVEKGPGLRLRQILSPDRIIRKEVVIIREGLNTSQVEAILENQINNLGIGEKIVIVDNQDSTVFCVNGGQLSELSPKQRDSVINSASRIGNKKGTREIRIGSDSTDVDSSFG